MECDLFLVLSPYLALFIAIVLIHGSFSVFLRSSTVNKAIEAIMFAVIKLAFIFKYTFKMIEYVLKSLLSVTPLKSLENNSSVPCGLFLIYNFVVSTTTTAVVIAVARAAVGLKFVM